MTFRKPSKKEFELDAPRLVWIYPDDLSKRLDAATWLETTRELRSLGWQVTLIAAGPYGAHVVQSVPLFGIPMPNIYLVRQIVFHLRALGLLLRVWDSVDVILFHQPSALWFLPLRVARLLLRRRLPLLVMDTRTVPMNKAKMRDRLREAFAEAMDRWANGWVDGRTAITKRMAEVVGIPSRKLWGVWPSGVNPQLFAKAQAARKWPEPNEALRLIYIGEIAHERHILELARAVRQANAQGMPILFNVVGSGAARDELARFAQQANGAVNVHLPVPHAEVPALLAEAHIGVLPFPDDQKFQVSSPIKLFEYMASGLPVLATRISCHTDVISDAPVAFWAEDATEVTLLAALTQCWNHRAQLPEMSRHAALHAQEWSWRAAASKLSAALAHGLRMTGRAQPVGVDLILSSQQPER